MLTLRRFKAMVDSYGADLLRWPEGLRTEAEMLLNVSRHARRLLGEAQVLDEAVEAASAREEAALWRQGDQDAALARLRSGVQARMAASIVYRPTGQHHGWTFWLQLRGAGMATGVGVAALTGFLLGAMDTSTPATDGVLAMLQPMPIHILSD